AHAAITESIATLPAGRRREQLSLLIQRARTECQLANLDAAQQTCDEVAALAASTDVARLRADGATARPGVGSVRGERALQERAGSEAESLARSVGHAVSLAMAWGHRGAAAARRGEITSARALCRDAQRHYEELGMPTAALDMRAELAELDRREHRIDAALDAALSVLADGRGDAVDATTGNAV